MLVESSQSPSHSQGVGVLCSLSIVQLPFQVVGALVYLSGELNFVNNSGGEDSALHLLSFAQVVLSRGLQINFEGNSGRYVLYIYIHSRVCAIHTLVLYSVVTILKPYLQCLIIMRLHTM